MDDYENCVETVAELKRRVAELEAAINRAFSDRDYWLQWKKAVPVEAIARMEKIARYLLAQTGRGAGGPAVDDCLSIQGWLLKLDAPEAKPSPVAAFAELSEKYHQYFDYETDEAQS
jgi:hypothetical protein